MISSLSLFETACYFSLKRNQVLNEWHSHEGCPCVFTPLAHASFDLVVSWHAASQICSAPLCSCSGAFFPHISGHKKPEGLAAYSGSVTQTSAWLADVCCPLIAPLSNALVVR